MTEKEIQEILRQQNEEFRRLFQEHRELDALLMDMSKKPYLTPDEELEKKRMQKEKLLKKDRMAELVREYKKTHNLVGQ
jgi:uncharacterized protein YdcH (DUF465 family)